MVTVDAHLGYAGFDVEIDGHRRPVEARSFQLTLQADKFDLVTFSASVSGLRGLRQRGLIADSPRTLVRDERAGLTPGRPCSSERPPRSPPGVGGAARDLE